MVWKKVAEKNDVDPGKGKEVIVDGKHIAIFNQNGFYALDSVCVHQDGSLTSGKVEGDVVECPLHFWHYNIKTGQLLDYIKGVRLRTYKVEAKVDGIYVDV